MLSNTKLLAMRTQFEARYPDYAKRLNACTTQTQLQQEYQAIYEEALAKAKPYLSADDGPTGFPVLALTPNQYQQLASATGDNIEVVVTSMLNTAKIIQPDWSVGQTTAQFITGGFTAMTAVGVGAFNAAIGSEAVMALAVAAGVEAVTVAGICAVVAVAIVAVIIPILYFMLKPACCFVCVLNETSQPMIWVDDYNVHGKPIGRVNQIAQAIYVPPPTPGAGTYVNCGFVQTDKRDDALVGTQYGFTYRYDNKNTVSFGTECPLTGIYVDNNCYCAINSSSQSVADQTDDHNVLTWKAAITSPSLTASIACNSGSGSVAYYIARVRDGTINPG